MAIALSPQRENLRLSEARWLNTILAGHCIDMINRVPPEAVDVIYAEPPSLLEDGPSPSRKSGDEQYDRLVEYDLFCRAWLLAFRKALKPTGTIWIVGGHDNIFRIGRIMQDLGFWFLNDIIWRQNSLTNTAESSVFRPTHKTIIWASRGAKNKNYTFNYNALKASNDDVQMRSDWSFPPRAETAESDGENFDAFLSRVVLASTNTGDVILDPFCGNGRMVAVAKRLGRNFVGIECEDEKIRSAEAMINSVRQFGFEELKGIPSRRSEPRIPFRSLIQMGLIKPGQILQDSRRIFEALVQPNGSLSCGNDVGSIHRLGARLQGHNQCNGWTFWHFQENERLLPIENLRSVARLVSSPSGKPA